MSTVEYITDENFDEEVLQADKPVLVDFTASWCGPCKLLAPTLDKIAAERDDLKIVKIDVGGNPKTREATNPETRKTYDISAFPTLYLFRNGKIADARQGMSSKDTLTNWLNEALDKPVANDMNDSGQVKIYLKSVEEERNKEAKEEIKKLAKNIGRKIKMVSAGLKFAGGITLVATGTGIPAWMLGGSALGISASQFTKAYKDDLADSDENPSTGQRALSAVFNAATLAAGIALFSTPTTGLLTGAAVVFGSWMILTGSSGVLKDVYKLASNNKDTTTTESTEELECKDGVCEIPSPKNDGPS